MGRAWCDGSAGDDVATVLALMARRSASASVTGALSPVLLVRPSLGSASNSPLVTPRLRRSASDDDKVGSNAPVLTIYDNIDNDDKVYKYHVIVYLFVQITHSISENKHKIDWSFNVSCTKNTINNGFFIINMTAKETPDS
jgi:hypothetical protein